MYDRRLLPHPATVLVEGNHGKHVEVLASGTGLFPLVQAGQLRMLVVWTEQRALQFPEVPTLMEAGQNLISASPYGLAGPKGMDPKIMKILHDVFVVPHGTVI